MTETIAQTLKRLIEEARAAGMKVSAKSLSMAVGGGETYVGDILRGRVRNPSVAKLSRIARQLKVPLSQLVPEDGLALPAPSYPELRDSAGVPPLLVPGILAAILTALPAAEQRLRHQPAPARTSEAIYRAHGWILDETAAGRRPGPDAIANFLSHIL